MPRAATPRSSRRRRRSRRSRPTTRSGAASSGKRTSRRSERRLGGERQAQLRPCAPREERRPFVVLQRRNRIGAGPDHAVDARQAVEGAMPLHDFSRGLEQAIDPHAALESQEDALVDLPLIVDVTRDQASLGTGFQASVGQEKGRGADLAAAAVVEGLEVQAQQSASCPAGVTIMRGQCFPSSWQYQSTMLRSTKAKMLWSTYATPSMKDTHSYGPKVRERPPSMRSKCTTARQSSWRRL